MTVPKCVSESGRHRWMYIARHDAPRWMPDNTYHWCQTCGAIGEKVNDKWCVDHELKLYVIQFPDGVIGK